MPRNNTPNSIKNEITALIYKLTHIGLAVDQNLPSIIRKGRNIDIIWDGQTHLSVALKKNSDYNKIYEEIFKERNYSLRFNDGAIIQISYRFNGHNLISHRLVYLPNPLYHDSNEYNDIEIVCEEEGGDDEDFFTPSNQSKIIMPIRFDYTTSGSQDIKHPMSHLHLGVFQDCRIPLNTPITPNIFIDFILRNFYSDVFYKNFLPSDFKFSKDFPVTITSGEEKIIHLNFKI